jgi:hypothetical protein
MRAVAEMSFRDQGQHTILDHHTLTLGERRTPYFSSPPLAVTLLVRPLRVSVGVPSVASRGRCSVPRLDRAKETPKKRNGDN